MVNTQVSSGTFTHLATQQSARSTVSKSTHLDHLVLQLKTTVLALSSNLFRDPLISTTERHFGTILN
jgi:hypothetical protein